MSKSDWDLIVMEDGETFGPVGGAVFATVTDDAHFALCEGDLFRGMDRGIKHQINLEAVPDMLEALRDVDDAWAGNGDMSAAVDKCLLAIEKAHVESPADQIGWDQ